MTFEHPLQTAIQSSPTFVLLTAKSPQSPHLFASGLLLEELRESFRAGDTRNEGGEEAVTADAVAHDGGDDTAPELEFCLPALAPVTHDGGEEKFVPLIAPLLEWAEAVDVTHDGGLWSPPLGELTVCSLRGDDNLVGEGIPAVRLLSSLLACKLDAATWTVRFSFVVAIVVVFALVAAAKAAFSYRAMEAALSGRCARNAAHASLIAKFGETVVFERTSPVMGFVLLFTNQSSMASRSKVKPPSTTTGSCMTSCVMGHIRNAGGSVTPADGSASSAPSAEAPAPILFIKKSSKRAAESNLGAYPTVPRL